MTYIVQETSEQGGQPIELYHFSQRLGTHRATLTSASTPITYSGLVYEPTTIKRTAPKLSQAASGSKITMTVPRDNKYAQRYLEGEPPLPDTVTVYRGHSTDPDGQEPEFTVIFHGEVAGVRYEGDTAKIILVSLASRLKRAIPKRTFSWSCNHVLFDGRCGVNRDDYFSEVDISAVSAEGLFLDWMDTPDTPFTLASERYAGDGSYFFGGYMEVPTVTGTYHRTIAALNETQFQLTVPLTVPIIGTTVKIFAGCFHDTGSCKAKFQNIANYGGFPFVPTENPFTDGLLKGR